MAKNNPRWKCSNCDRTYTKWIGMCAGCKEYGTISEEVNISARTGSVGLKGNLEASHVARSARRVNDIDTKTHRHSPTGIAEFDRTLGGGLVSGQTVLLAGEPGVGKALALDTLLVTPDGYTTMAEVKVGDLLVDSLGNTTQVVAATGVMTNRNCFKITFEDKTTVVADADHEWYCNVNLGSKESLTEVKTTRGIFLETLKESRKDSEVIIVSSDGKTRHLISKIELAEPVPVKCVQVDSPDHTYLITKSHIPTHNSTILLAVADSIAKTGKTVLYVSGEESAEQITLRARRTNTLADDLFIADETDLSVLLGHIEQVDPDLLIVDSVQTIASPDIDGRAGGISQVQEVATTLTRVAKSRHMPLVLVGQVTKEGSIGGPKQLEHLVDTVIEFFGDRNTPLRIMRVVKNRMGPADEVSCWEQTETGIVEVPDPSGLFRTGREEPIAGTCLTVTIEGRRAILAELQALVAPTQAPNPRRGVSGLDKARMDMLVAVTEKHGRMQLFNKDTYIATVAGMRIIEPAADLAVCLAIASANWDDPLPLDVAAIGEVALSGDIRKTTNMGLRLNEAVRLGFKRILVPVGTVKPAKLDVILLPVANIGLALRALKQLSATLPKSSLAEEVDE